MKKKILKRFLEAVAVGTKRFQEAVPKTNEGTPQFNFVEIERPRKNGVLPIAW